MTADEEADLGRYPWTLTLARLLDDDPTGTALVILPDEAMRPVRDGSTSHAMDAALVLARVLGGQATWCSRDALEWSNQHTFARMARYPVVLVADDLADKLSDRLALEEVGAVQGLYHAGGYAPLVVICGESAADDAEEVLGEAVADAFHGKPTHRMRVTPDELCPGGSPAVHRGELVRRIEALPDTDDRQWQADLGLLLLTEDCAGVVVVEQPSGAGKSYAAKALAGLLNGPRRRVRYVDCGDRETVCRCLALADIVFVEVVNARVVDVVLAGRSPECRVVFLCTDYAPFKEQLGEAVPELAVFARWVPDAEMMEAGLIPDGARISHLVLFQDSGVPSVVPDPPRPPTYGLEGAELAAAIKRQLDADLPGLDWTVWVDEGDEEGSATAPAPQSEAHDGEPEEGSPTAPASEEAQDGQPDDGSTTAAAPEDKAQDGQPDEAQDGQLMPWSGVAGFCASTGVSLSLFAEGLHLEGAGLTVAEALADARRNLEEVQAALDALPGAPMSARAQHQGGAVTGGARGLMQSSQMQADCPVCTRHPELAATPADPWPVWHSGGHLVASCDCDRCIAIRACPACKPNAWGQWPTRGRHAANGRPGASKAAPDIEEGYDDESDTCESCGGSGWRKCTDLCADCDCSGQFQRRCQFCNWGDS